MRKIIPIRLCFILLSVFMSCLYINSQNTSDARITNTDFKLEGNQLIITYDIENYRRNDKFTTNAEVFYESGEKITAKALSGDINEDIQGGMNKTIIWDLDIDNVELEGRIYVEVTAVPELGAKVTKEKEEMKSFSLAGTLAPSLVFPGYGNTRITRKPYWILGIAAYSSLVTSYIFNQSAASNYNQYLKERSYSDIRYAHYDDAEADKQISTAFGVAAGVIWAADITLLIINHKKHKKNLSSALKQRTSFGYNYNPELQANMLTVKIIL